MAHSLLLIMAKVGILMGSDSDLPVMQEAAKILKEFEVEYEMKIYSAHRTPALAADFAHTARQRGLQVIIAGAGMANHLAGAMAAHSTLPVIGVPLDISPLKGLDALMSTAQMPPGVPVATVAIGKAGAKNAAYLALQIIGVADESIAKKLEQHRQTMEKEILAKNAQLTTESN